MDTAENLVLKCVEAMLLMPAIEHMTRGDIVRATSMIAASHPRPANGRIEGIAMWLTALCVRLGERYVDDVRPPSEPRAHLRAHILQDIQKAAPNLPPTREQVARAAEQLDDRAVYDNVVRLGGSALALAIQACSGRQVAFSNADRAACAEAHLKEETTSVIHEAFQHAHYAAFGRNAADGDAAQKELDHLAREVTAAKSFLDLTVRCDASYRPTIRIGPAGQLALGELLARAYDAFQEAIGNDRRAERREER